MIVVIFESWPKKGRGNTYLEMGQSMMSLVEGFDGFISIERFESVVQRGETLLSIGRFRVAVDTLSLTTIGCALHL